MSKKRLLLASAILSVATLAASCGGGGGGTASATTTTPPPSTTTTPPSPTVGSLGTPAVFTRLSPAGAGQDRYYFVDGSGNKVEVTDLAGKDITTVLYQFNNANLLVRTATNQVFCVDVSNASAKDLGLTFAGHAYANVTNELVRNRPYFLMNATDGGYVITKDCNAKKVSSTQFAQIMNAADANKQAVFAINNTYAIVRDANITSPSVFVVRSDGSFDVVVNQGKNPGLRTDNTIPATKPTANHTVFVVGDNNANLPVYLVTDTGTPVMLATTPLSNFGPTNAINQFGNTYNVILSDNKAITEQLTGFRVAGGAANQYFVNKASLQCGGVGTFQIHNFDLDAEGNLFAVVLASSGAATQCAGVTVAATATVVVGISNNGSHISSDLFTATTGQAITGSTDANRIIVAGLSRGALVGAHATNAAVVYALNPGFTVQSVGNVTCANADDIGSVFSAWTDARFAVGGVYAASSAARIKGARTNQILFGVTSGTVATNNTFARVTINITNIITANCAVTNVADIDTTETFSNNLDRNITNAFVFHTGGTTLREVSPVSGTITIKSNVQEPHFAGNACGALGQLVQIYSATDRACVTPVAGGFTYNYVNYNTDAITPNTITGAGAGINAPTFGDVANNNNSLFTYLDSAANRGTVSFCPSGNTWEYLILGNQNVQYPASGSQTVGLCFKVFNSFNGAGGVGNNNALGVPFIKF